MYNRTEKRWLESTYSAIMKGKVLFSKNVKSGMFVARHAIKGELSLLFNPICLFDNKTCTKKRGHGRNWYVQKEPHHGEVGIWNYVKTCRYMSIFLYISIFFYGNVPFFCCCFFFTVVLFFHLGQNYLFCLQLHL